MKKVTTYDLYLRKACDTLPNLSDLATQVSVVTYPVFLQWIVKDTADELGFLHLDLTKSVAVELLKRLQSAQAVGLVIKAAYRRPRVTFADACSIAEYTLEELQARQFPGYSFGLVTFYGERLETWTFVCASERLFAEGYVPGALFADVDKIDGHVWQLQEYQER